MSGSFLLSIATFIYGGAGFFYIFAWIFRKPAAGAVATWIAILGFIVNTAGILIRWIGSYKLGIGHAPFSNLYESLVFFAWVIALIYLIIERKFGNRIVGAFTTPIACLALAYASLKPGITSDIQPLIPALKSNWLIAHVITCFVGYASFAIAFGVSSMYLIKYSGDEEKIIWMDIVKPLVLYVILALFCRVLLVGNWTLAVIIALPICFIFYAVVLLARRMPVDYKNRLLDKFPEKRVLDELTHQLIVLGFLFLSAGIITGAVWANSAWGRYWGWDPKETWSLITWFIYATLLHARTVRGWHGKRIAFLSMFGFAAVLFTYFGVNLLPGLHSYGAI